MSIFTTDCRRLTSVLGLALILVSHGPIRADGDNGNPALRDAGTSATEGSDNPFFSAWNTPFDMPPFERIESRHFAPAFEAALAEYEEELRRIRDNPDPPDFTNTILALERAGESLRRVRGVFTNAVNTGSNPQLAALELELAPKLAHQVSRKYLDPVMFERVESVYGQREGAELSPIEARLLFTTHRGFLRSGAALDEADKSRLRQVNERLSELSSRFRNNVLLATRDFTLLVEDEAQLDGLSGRSKAAARRAARAAGHAEGWLFGLGRSAFEDFMIYAENADLRRRMLEGYRSRGPNGQPGHRRGAGPASRRTRAPAGVRQLRRLPARNTHGPLAGAPAWHADVRSWSVYAADGRFLGVFMADDFARKGKRGGAWKSSYRGASRIDGVDVRPIVVNNFNFVKPAPGEPALLNLREVKTLFHEFGHALQSLMTTVPFRSLSGSSGTPQDYREFPSQFFERYATAPEVLSQYARHFQTGEPMPQELVARIQEVESHNQGFRTSESITAAMLDLDWHTLEFDEAAAITDVLRQEAQILDNLGPLPEIGPRYRSPYFTHIFAGAYSAGYYAYLWSEVLDADAFAAFRASGDIFDPELGRRLRENIFEAGASENADVLYRRFRGRDPDVTAFLQSRGLDH